MDHDGVLTREGFATEFGQNRTLEVSVVEGSDVQYVWHMGDQTTLRGKYLEGNTKCD